MTEESLRRLLERVRSGGLSIDEAVRQAKTLAVEDLGFAHLDHHRAMRRGFPEVIFCEGKSVEQIVSIAKALHARGGTILASRASPEAFAAVREAIPDAEYQAQARMVVLGDAPPAPPEGEAPVLVMSAGTADLPVAEEAAITAAATGARVERVYDVGVAGLHRLLEHREQLESAQAIIVVAGMEGALASVVGGLVDKPVVAVPTSVGYGASFEGLSALLTMLNACASGVVVVNIDNGFGAGYFAGMLAKQRRHLPK